MELLVEANLRKLVHMIVPDLFKPSGIVFRGLAEWLKALVR